VHEGITPISGLGGVALTRYMDGLTDGRTDRMIPIYPPSFVGVIIIIGWVIEEGPFHFWSEESVMFWL
jgi:hypothetical protein